MRLGLVSAKGSPGATTLGLALAAVTGGVLVEADPAGGDVECWAGPSGEPGLIRLAGVLRHAAEPAGLLAEHAIEVWSGVRAVLAPTSGEQAESALVAIGQRLVPVLTAESGWVVVDGGRWSRGQTTAGRLAGCDVVAVVVSPTFAAAAHAGSVVRTLRELTDAEVVVVVVGDRGYRPDEITAALGVAVLGVVPWEPWWVGSLVTSGVTRLWQHSPLASSARTLADQCAALRQEVVAGG